MAAGIVEIAKRAGVSAATVSRALRGLHHVHAKTRAKIIEAALALDYPLRADLLPRGTSSHTNVVGIIAPYISRWYFAQVIAGTEQALREAGMDLLLYNFSRSDARQRVFQPKQLIGKVDALIVVSMPPTEAEFKWIMGTGIPISLIGTTHDGCASVVIDDVEGARQATQHLIDLGHRKIALVGGGPLDIFGFPVHEMRKQGFLKAHNESGIEWNSRYEAIGDFTQNISSLAMEKLLDLKVPPTAVFCESDEMAYGVLETLKRRGIKVPDEISLIGFDNHEMAEFVDLTTVAQPVHFMGQMAATSIMAKINRPDSELLKFVVPTSLILRGSTKAI